MSIYKVLKGYDGRSTYYRNKFSHRQCPAQPGAVQLHTVYMLAHALPTPATFASTYYTSKSS